jgi:transcriptional regulator with XRE-family HTH domain
VEGLELETKEHLIARRLRAARVRAGHKTAQSFAREIGVNSSTYTQHENGYRPINAESAMRYATRLRMNPAAFLYGEELSVLARSRIVGTLVGNISGDGVVTPVAQSEQKQLIFLPETTEMDALLIVDDDQWPAYRAGDTALYRPLVECRPPLDRFHSKECVVQLVDGRLLVRQVIGQPNGLATLIAYHAPPIVDADIVAASVIEVVIRSGEKPQPIQ